MSLHYLEKREPRKCVFSLKYSVLLQQQTKHVQSVTNLQLEQHSFLVGYLSNSVNVNVSFTLLLNTP